MVLQKQYDVLTISETWFNSTITNISVEIKGYQIFRLDRLGKTGAGVCAYVRHGLKSRVLKDLSGIGESGLHQLWLQIQNKKLRSVLLCIVYRPPDIGLSCLEDELMPAYLKALSQNKDIVLTGDANCDLLSENPKGVALRSFCASINAHQLIDKPTRVTVTSRSLLDVIMVSNKAIARESGVLELTISDHYLVYVVLDMKVPKPSPTYITTRSFKNYTADQFSSDIAHVPWGTVELMDSVDDRVDAFNTLFLTCLNNHAPIKTLRIKRKPNPAITVEIKERIKARNVLHTRARKSGSHRDWKAFTDLRREIKQSIRQAEQEYFMQQVITNKANTGSLWKTIRQALPNKSSQRPQYTRDTDVLANEFNRFFISVGQEAAKKSVELASHHGLQYNIPMPQGTPSLQQPSGVESCFVFQAVTPDDVRKVILGMPANKAPGFDKVPISVIKDCLEHILPTLTDLINNSFSSSVFPRAWKKGEVVPHLKEGDHEEANNNRPISLLPVLSKVAERIAMRQFNDYLMSHNRLTTHQSGNRSLHSTETLSLLVTDNIFRAIDSGQITAMVLIDLSKAFDSLCHSTLLSKLRLLGTSEKALLWFKSYLSDRQQCTRIGPSLSDPLTVTHGVPQGSILGPMLFTLYMNDLPTVTKFSNIESYVDDTKIYLSCASKDIHSCLHQVTQDLESIATWCCANHLLINPNKTKLVLFGTSQLVSKLSDVTVPFLGQQLIPVSSAKDLGVILDSSLTFSSHISSLSSSLLSSLCQISRVRHLFSKEALLIMINSLVFSKLFYCSTVWSGTYKQNIHKLQLIQNFAARILTDTRKYDHITPALKALGWLPIEEQLQLRDVIMMYKCVNNLAPAYLSCKLGKRSDSHAYNLRNSDHLNIPKCRTVAAQRGFFYRATKAWNTLSSETRTAQTITSFKKRAKAELRLNF